MPSETELLDAEPATHVGPFTPPTPANDDFECQITNNDRALLVRALWRLSEARPPYPQSLEASAIFALIDRLSNVLPPLQLRLVRSCSAEPRPLPRSLEKVRDPRLGPVIVPNDGFCEFCGFHH